MSKFKFRLATLLKIRESTRDERRRALAEAYRADDMLRERIDETRSEMQNLMETCRKAVGPGAVNVDSLIDAQRYELLLQSQLHQLQQKRRQLAEEIERRRVALLNANREVKILEKLRENQLTRYRETESYREMRRLDEVAQQRAAAVMIEGES